MNEPKLEFDPQSLPWVDRDSFAGELAGKLERGEISAADADLLRQWRTAGYLQLRGAIAEAEIDELIEDYERAWRERPAVGILTEDAGRILLPDAKPRHELSHHHYRFLDFQDVSEPARRLMLHPAIVRPLALIFGETPVAMQSLYFEYGSEQRIHQDFPYVQAQILSHLAAAWVACEAVDADNGPLFYHPGSQRLPKFDWGAGSLLFNGSFETIEDFESYLAARCEELGFAREELRAEKGDVFLWHASLAHGGAPVLDRTRTRASFVVHYSTATAYPRCRRFPEHPPRLYEANGARLYLPPA